MTQSNGVPQTKANQTHSAFAWKSQGDGRWYVVLVDDLEELDVDILDITNPSKPKLVAEWNLDSTAQTGPAGRTATPSSATTWWSRRSAARTSC